MCALVSNMGIKKKKKRSSAEMTSTKRAEAHKSNMDAESKYYGG